MTHTTYTTRTWTRKSGDSQCQFVATVRKGDLVTLTKDGDVLPERPIKVDTHGLFVGFAGTRFYLSHDTIDAITVRTPVPRLWWKDNGAEVRDCDGDLWHWDGYYWRSPSTEHRCTADELEEQYGPITPTRSSDGRVLLTADERKAIHDCVRDLNRQGMSWDAALIAALDDLHGYPEDGV